MSSSNYHNNSNTTFHTNTVEECIEEPSDTNARSHEHYYSACKEKIIDYPSFPEPQLPSHHSLNQTIFQDDDNYNNVTFPTPYSYEKEAEEEGQMQNDAIICSDPIFDLATEENNIKEESYNKDYNRASTSAAIYTPNIELEKKVAESNNIGVPEEASNVNDKHVVVLARANEEKYENGNLSAPHEGNISINKRDTLIGDEKYNNEKTAMGNEQANEAQRLEDERKLQAKMEKETKNRVFQPEAGPEAVYVPSAKPRTDIAKQNCCWGCLAWICCWSSPDADKK